ncbi:MAG: hypothetical protein U0074_21485, partial [Kouleothrix sp.]
GSAREIAKPRYRGKNPQFWNIHWTPLIPSIKQIENISLSYGSVAPILCLAADEQLALALNSIQPRHG